MLRIFYGDLNDDKYISVPDVFFDDTYEDEWITDGLRDVSDTQKYKTFHKVYNEMYMIKNLKGSGDH